MTNLSIMLQAAGGQSQMSGIIMIVALFAIFYFFMIRPQQKKQKEIRKFRESIKAGDKIITAGGIYGVVEKVSDYWFLVSIDKGVEIRVDKGSVYASPEDAQQQQQMQKQ